MVWEDGVITCGDSEIKISADEMKKYLVGGFEAACRDNTRLKDNNYNQFYGKKRDL